MSVGKEPKRQKLHEKYNLMASQNKPLTTVVKKYLKSKDKGIILSYQNKVIQYYMVQRQCEMFLMSITKH